MSRADPALALLAHVHARQPDAGPGMHGHSACGAPQAPQGHTCLIPGPTRGRQRRRTLTGSLRRAQARSHRRTAGILRMQPCKAQPQRTTLHLPSIGGTLPCCDTASRHSQCISSPGYGPAPLHFPPPHIHRSLNPNGFQGECAGQTRTAQQDEEHDADAPQVHLRPVDEPRRALPSKPMLACTACLTG